jgi:NAD(P)H-hydrate epimerase
MIKIFSSEQIHQADKYTIEHEPVKSIDLMERAASACVTWIEAKFDTSLPFMIICGKGNNGGDGLAIARLLFEKKYHVAVVVINHSENASTDFSENLNRLNSKIKSVEISTLDEFERTIAGENSFVVIDALFGSGLNRPVDGIAKQVIQHLNSLAVTKIAIDIPSGLFADIPNDKNDIVLNADYTLTFQFPKLSFMFAENAAYVGAFTILDIGLHKKYIADTNSNHLFVTQDFIHSLIHKRNPAAHKGNFGHALLFAGSYGKIGAAVLSAKACLRSGVGMLTLRIPKCGYTILQTTVPEAMIDTDIEDNFISDAVIIDKYNAIGVGPGIGTEKQTQNVLKLLIQNTTVPFVFDADAINILSENKTWLSFLPPNCIFTPHIKEFERLVGKCNNALERIEKQKEFSLKYSAYIVLKGAHTSISGPDGYVYFNSTGNPGMATAGSGDVLTGIITALKAQGYNSLYAAIIGVYMHGLAGDFAAEQKSQQAMIASDIIDNLPQSFKFITETYEA